MSQRSKIRQVTNWLFLLSLLLLAGAAWGQSGTISTATFGMQCGPGVSTNCPVVSGTITLPTEPGTLRLWDSEVEWSALNPSCSSPPCTSWNWTNLDYYLDAIAADSSLSDVIYTFGWVPCWDATSCSDTTNHRTSTPPSDLNSSGSSTFNAFVTALVQHCSAAHPTHCVKNLIKYYEMWNEANSTTYWNPGSNGQQLLYEMVAPAVSIIESNVSGAVILTPSVTANGGESWMATWLQTEVSKGIISNLYNFHTYLNTSTPETTWLNVVAPGTSTSPGLLYPNYHTTGWTALSWGISETNFENGSEPNPYTCDSTYSVADCTGQVVRWQVILNSNGALNLSWYYWNATIGELGASGRPYATAYYYMMQYMVGGSFTAACSYTTSGGIQTWTCPFTEGSGTTALFVWTPSPSGTTYTVPSGYVDYRDLAGGTTSVTGGQHITIGVEPFMLEK
jgi:hypothetical protein